jgi:uncharacterized membrane protein SpoIIM required for sporulation
MNVDTFYHSRRGDWERLEKLLEEAQKSPQRLRPDQVQAIGSLYRKATSDLAFAQRDYPNHELTQFLNQLVAQAHALVYRGEPLGIERFKRFVLAGFPRAFRRAYRYILVAALALFGPALLAGFLTYWQPESARWILPVGAQGVIRQLERQELWTDIPLDQRPYASTFIMQNNIQVSIMAFGVGALAAVPTVLILATNGLMLGGVMGLAAHYGVGDQLATFVIGHGVIELSVVTIAGGAGLMLGWAVIQPRMMRRRDALSLAARRAIRLLAGAVPLLVVAGLIEGLISPAEGVSWQVKLAIGLLSGLALYAYLLLAGRDRPQSVRASSSPLAPNND